MKMLQKEVDPKVAAILTVVALAAVQAVYYKNLVVQTPGAGGGGGAGGAPMVPRETIVGRQDVLVSDFVGEAPGMLDGPRWQARLSGPNALASMPDGGLLIADSRNHRIRLMSPGGVLSTFAGSGDVDSMGGKSDGPVDQARFKFPSGVCVSPDGTVYISDTGNHRVCAVSGGQVRTLAGSGQPGKADGSGPAAAFNSPGTMVWQGGSVWVADLGNRVFRRVTPTGAVTTPTPPAEVKLTAGQPWPPSKGEAISAYEEGRGELTVSTHFTGRLSSGARIGGLWVWADAQHHTLVGRLGTGPIVLLSGHRDTFPAKASHSDGDGPRASYAAPSAVAARADGTVFVADFEGNRIRKVELPRWMIEGDTAPPIRSSRFGRDFRGR